jgi:hypothetical protein
MLPGGYLIPFDEAFAVFDLLHGIRDELLAIFPEPYIDCFRFLTDKSDGAYAFGRVDSPSHGQILKLEIHAPNLIGFRDLEHLLKIRLNATARESCGLPPESLISTLTSPLRLV